MPQSFDLACFEDAAIRHHYARLLQRGQSMANALHAAYGIGKKPIQVRYIAAPDFNAAASMDNTHYWVDIHSNIPLLIFLLFQKLFEDKEIFPWLSANDPIKANFEVGFITDIHNFTQTETWDIKLTEQRAHAAKLLADMATTFIFAHELGHIVSGHVEAALHFEGKTRYIELFKRVGQLPVNIERRQAWEADADAFGATCLIDYLLELHRIAQQDHYIGQIFLEPNEDIENLLGLAMAIFFVLFSYTHDQKRKFNLTDAHPHPYVRCFYVKDMLFSAALSRFDVDIERTLQFMTYHAQNFLDQLSHLGLYDGYGFDVDKPQSEIFQNDSDRIYHLRKQYRDSCQQWSWIDWA